VAEVVLEVRQVANKITRPHLIQVLLEDTEEDLKIQVVAPGRPIHDIVAAVVEVVGIMDHRLI